MIINAPNLDLIYRGYNAAYRGGLLARQASSQHSIVALTVPSGTESEEYGWLEEIPNMREWFGERTVHGLKHAGFTIKNRDFELTIGVDRNKIEDDKYGLDAMRFTAMGQSVAAHPDQLVWPLLKAGFENECWDGQNFFDTDHPVEAEDGSRMTVSNTSVETDSEPWYLMDNRMMFRPLLFQQRKKADDIIRRDRDTDDNVFSTRRFEYGVHCRDNVGYGWWQLCFGSRAPLNSENYEKARAALTGMLGDHGRPLGLMPDTLVVPPNLEKEALEITNAERNAQGATNVWKGTAKATVVPWLA